MTQSYGWNLQHSRNKINDKYVNTSDCAGSAVPLHRALGALSSARTAYTAAVVAVAMTLLLLWRGSSNSVCVTHGTDAVLVYFTTLRQLWRRWICWTFTCVAKFRRSLVTSGPISRKIRACLLMTCYRVCHTWLCSLLFVHLKAHVLMFSRKPWPCHADRVIEGKIKQPHLTIEFYTVVILLTFILSIRPVSIKSPSLFHYRLKTSLFCKSCPP